MKTGKWFIKPVLPVTIFVKVGGIWTSLQPEFVIVFVHKMSKKSKINLP